MRPFRYWPLWLRLWLADVLIARDQRKAKLYEELIANWHKRHGQ